MPLRCFAVFTRTRVQLPLTLSIFGKHMGVCKRQAEPCIPLFLCITSAHGRYYCFPWTLHSFKGIRNFACRAHLRSICAKVENVGQLASPACWRCGSNGPLAEGDTVAPMLLQVANHCKGASHGAIC